MNDSKQSLIQRMLAESSELPTGTLSRLRKTAAVGLKAAWLAREGAQLDVHAVAGLVEGIGQLKGIAMKAAQVMSYVDVALPDELRQALTVLQTHSPPMPIEAVKKIIRAELGKEAHKLLGKLEERPLAAASIGQVHRSTLPGGQPVAVKVQYPGIDRAIDSDFGPALLASPIAGTFYPGAQVEALVEEAKRRFREECDYGLEAQRQQRFHELFAAHPDIAVPKVWPKLSSRRVLTTEFRDGLGLTEYIAEQPSASRRDRLGRALFDFYFGTLFAHGLYNCDPHPGNVLVAGEQLVMLDYGCCREFSPRFIRGLVDLSRAVSADDAPKVHAALSQLGVRPTSGEFDPALTRRLTRAFFGPMLEDREQVIELGAGSALADVFTQKRQLMKLVLPGEFLFLFRLRFGLLSVLSQLGARQNWYQLEQAAIARALVQ